jgi:uncharacterized protein (TIGR00270 family)
MPDCEMCGKHTEDLYLITLEGAKLSVCERCCGYGKSLGKVREAPKKKETVIIKEIPEREVINDYDAIIKNRREAMGLSVEDFAQKVGESVSVIRKIEAGKTTPSEHTAEKMDKILKTKLYQLVKRESIENVKKEKKSLTLEDIVFMKKKE